MPIVDIEIILKPNEMLRDDLASETADALGKIFDSPPGTTWVKLHALTAVRYAENGETQKSIFPIFVKIIRSRMAGPDEIQNEVTMITSELARICERPPENVQIIFEPNGAGRVAFGGKLVNQ